MRLSGSRLQRLLAVALLPVSLGAVVLHCALSPQVPFLCPDPQAPWMMAPTRVSALLEQWGRESTSVTRFSRDVELAARPEHAVVVLRALRDFTLRVNGELPPGGHSEGGDWRRARRVEVAPLLRKGGNRIEVEVTNRHGPGLLSLRVEGPPVPTRIVAWQTWIDDAPLGPAIAADDTRPNGNAYTLETPWEALLACRNALLLLFVAGAAGLLWWVRRARAGLAQALPGAALSAAGLAWVWLFVTRVVRIPLGIGFDGRAHLEYLHYLIDHRALPLATDGWSMYHPPLFYVIAATALHEIGENAVKVVTWISGLGLVFLAHSFAGRLHRDDPRVTWLAVAFAAALPVNLYSAAYVSNESLHALLAGLALLASVDALLAPASRWRELLAVGLWLALAALTKFTVLAIVPVALFFLGVKLRRVERMGIGAVAGRLAAVAGLALVLAGWFYARTWWDLGSPLVGNWALPGPRQVWWQQPGFHTLAYYTHFGESLHHPYLAGFRSFWDGVYSTFWGDGDVAGRVYPQERHGFWSYDFMSAGYLLALPLTACLLLGIGRTVVAALRDLDPGRRAALSFLLTSSYAIAFAFASLTLSLPYFAQAKAPYALCLTPVLSVWFASGAAWIDDRCAAPGRLPLRLAFAGLCTAALGCLFLGFAG